MSLLGFSHQNIADQVLPNISEGALSGKITETNISNDPGYDNLSDTYRTHRPIPFSLHSPVSPVPRSILRRSVPAPPKVLVHLPVVDCFRGEVRANVTPCSLTDAGSSPQGGEAIPTCLATIDVFNLGVQFDRGDGVQIHFVKAAQCYLLAAEQGHVDSKYNLGTMYANGQGVQQGFATCLLWHLAQFSVGLMFEKGRGVLQDLAKAEEWYRSAAMQGNADAQCNLGNMLLTGQGARRNSSAALHWFEFAADQGHPVALEGAMFLQARERNSKEAAK
jgi:hypothetical protein